MGIKHSYTATGTNDAGKQVSKDRWNEDHAIDMRADTRVLRQYMDELIWRYPMGNGSLPPKTNNVP